jgi:hypothetical protein
MNKKWDSKEEFYFSLYLDELVDAGYVLEYELHPKPFLLSGKSTVTVTKQLKTKVKLLEKTFLQEHIYTPDYLVMWAESAKGLFFSEIKGGAPFWLSSTFNSSYIEVKPTFSRYNMQRVFSLNQKWCFNKHGEYVNLIKPCELFKKTFTPIRYLTTDISGKPRKINYKVFSLEEYINQKESL